jgi:ElaB/YqjD/DUF883 family membrane-anchored ribosome-binding protein
MALRRRRKTSRNGHDVQARLNALRADLDALQEDMRGLVTEVGGAASEQVQGAMSGVISTAQEAVDRIDDWSTENLGGMREAVRSQPLAACVLSMSAGALLGALLIR